LTAAVIDDHVSLAWEAASTGPAPSSFVVEAAAIDDSSFAAVATTLVPRLTVARATVGAWRVRVRALTAGGMSEPSAPVDVRTAACTAAPGAPQDAWVIGTPSSHRRPPAPPYYDPRLTLRWSPPLTGAVHECVVEVGSAMGAADLARFTVDGGVTALSVVGQEYPLHRNFVRVRARNACGEGLPSNSVGF
jgi:hypothetical protein